MTAVPEHLADELLPAALGLSADGAWLVFTQHGSKVYARTPRGEYAFGDHQGLYEWRRGADGRSHRIDHTGGDQAAVHDGRSLAKGGIGDPKRRGLRHALAPRQN